MNKLHSATIVQHRRAGGEYFRLILEARGLAASAAPGRFVMLRVSGNLDPLLARPFGIASAPDRNTIELYYRVAGRGTALLSALEPGTTLGLTGPVGNGFPRPGRRETPLLVAGGSGFPPLLFFAERFSGRARLFAGSRDKGCLPPAGVMKRFRDTVQSIHYATEDGSLGVCGFVTDSLFAFLEGPGGAERPVIYACGPRPMLAAVSAVAARRKVPCYVSMEERMACGLGVCMGCAVPAAGGGYRRVCAEGPVFDACDLEWGANIIAPSGALGRFS